MHLIETVNSAVNDFVWGLPMLILLVGTGILMTALTGFFQVTHIGHWFSNTLGGIFKNKHVTAHTAQHKSVPHDHFTIHSSKLTRIVGDKSQALYEETERSSRPVSSF